MSIINCLEIRRVLRLYIFSSKFFSNNQHYEAKLCILCIVSGFRDKDAPFVLLLFFHFLWPFRQNLNVFKDLSLESRNIQSCAPIQCTVSPRNELISFLFLCVYDSFLTVCWLSFFLGRIYLVLESKSCFGAILKNSEKFWSKIALFRRVLLPQS